MKISARSQKLFNVYLTHCLSSSSDAGWHGQNVLQRLIDFKGDLPVASGYMPTDTMEREVRFLKKSHYLFPIAEDFFCRWQEDKAKTCFMFYCLLWGRVKDFESGRAVLYRLNDVVQAVNEESAFSVSLSTLKRLVASVDELICCSAEN